MAYHDQAAVAVWIGVHSLLPHEVQAIEYLGDLAVTDLMGGTLAIQKVRFSMTAR